MERVVCKFGGSSVAEAAQIRKVADILRADPRRRYVVVSAPGKRGADDRKVTDLLYLCHELVEGGLAPDEPFGLLRERYCAIARELGVEQDVARWCDQVHRRLLDGAPVDEVVSRGEYLSARLIADFLGATFVDTAERILLSEEGRLLPESYPRLRQALDGPGPFVLPGFYGSTPDGRIKTFSRGGSDISGAIVASSVEAALYENWTDVSGFLMADPRIVPEARVISEITYRELRELAYRGATVLHDEAIFPVREKRIPIHIRNTNSPDDPGSLILSERDSSRMPIVGVAGQADFAIIEIAKTLMNKEIGFGRKVLEIVESHGISFEHAPTGIDSMCVVVREAAVRGRLDDLVDDFRRVLEPDSVDVIPNMALIATVGLGMSHRIGIASRLFSALARENINVRMIDQPPDEITIIVGVDRSDYERATAAVYHEFVEA
jgi:aspartate kinase